MTKTAGARRVAEGFAATGGPVAAAQEFVALAGTPAAGPAQATPAGARQ